MTFDTLPTLHRIVDTAPLVLFKLVVAIKAQIFSDQEGRRAPVGIMAAGTLPLFHGCVNSTPSPGVNQHIVMAFVTQIRSRP